MLFADLRPPDRRRERQLFREGYGAHSVIPAGNLIRPSTIGLGASLLALFGAIALLLQVPLPAIDDLFYSGAAIELVRHGRLANPWLDGQHFLSADFLIYPPIYQWLLAAWLYIWGISTTALLTFQYLWYTVFGVTCTAVLMRYRIAPRALWLWPVVFAAGMFATIGTMGLRPDACGLAVLTTGFLLRAQLSVVHRIAGWSLIGLSIAISPHTLPYAAAVVLLVLVADYQAGRLRSTELGFAALGALVSIGLFLLSIEGRVHEFTRAFLHHSKRAVAPLGHGFLLGLSRVWSRDRLHPLYWFALMMAVALITIAFFRRRQNSARFYWLGGATSLALATGVISLELTWVRDELGIFTVTLWLLIVLYWLASKPRTTGFVITGLAAITAGFVWQSLPADVYGWCRIGPSAAEVNSAQAAVQRDPNRRYLVDAWTARYVFDYRLPARALDWSFSEPFPGLWPTSVDRIPTDETWIVSGWSLRLIAPNRVPPLAVGVRFAGRQLCYFPADRSIFTLDGRRPIPEEFRPHN